MAQCLKSLAARSRCFGGSLGVRAPGPMTARPPPSVEKDLFEICRSEGCICPSYWPAHPNGEGNLAHAPPAVCSPADRAPRPPPLVATDRVSADQT